MKIFDVTFKSNSIEEGDITVKNKSKKSIFPFAYIKNIFLYLVPQLNLENLSNLNYDSEKEFYLDNQDKLRRIKERFEKIKEMK